MSNNNTSYSLGGLFLLAFIIIKVAGTALASWSWLWVLLPIVPVLVLVFKSLGWL